METQEKLEEKAKELNEIDKKIKEKLDELQTKIKDYLFFIYYHRGDDTIFAKYKGHENGHILQVDLFVRYDLKAEKFVADVKENYRDSLIGVSLAEAIGHFVHRSEEMTAF